MAFNSYRYSTFFQMDSGERYRSFQYVRVYMSVLRYSDEKTYTQKLIENDLGFKLNFKENDPDGRLYKLYRSYELISLISDRLFDREVPSLADLTKPNPFLKDPFNN